VGLSADLLLVRAGRKEAELARASKSIVACDMAQLMEERRALLHAGARELTERMLGSWAWRELTAADCERHERQHLLIIFRELPKVVSQAVERTGVLFQAFAGYSLRGGGSAEEQRAFVEVTNEGFAGRYRHGPEGLSLRWPA
jgi:hypothetical protein